MHLLKVRVCWILMCPVADSIPTRLDKIGI